MSFSLGKEQQVRDRNRGSFPTQRSRHRYGFAFALSGLALEFQGPLLGFGCNATEIGAVVHHDRTTQTMDGSGSWSVGTSVQFSTKLSLGSGLARPISHSILLELSPLLCIGLALDAETRLAYSVQLLYTCCEPHAAASSVPVSPRQKERDRLSHLFWQPRISLVVGHLESEEPEKCGPSHGFVRYRMLLD